MTNENAIRDLLTEVFNGLSDSSDTLFEDLAEYVDGPVENVETFEEAGVLTNNKGLVITMADRKQFEITIIER